jgi:hypothetical protein
MSETKQQRRDAMSHDDTRSTELNGKSHHVLIGEGIMWRRDECDGQVSQQAPGTSLL